MKTIQTFFEARDAMPDHINSAAELLSQRAAANPNAQASLKRHLAILSSIKIRASGEGWVYYLTVADIERAIADLERGILPPVQK